MRAVLEAVIALSPSPSGFTASDLAARVHAIGDEHHAQYAPATDLKKLRRKHILARIGRTRRYEALPSGLRAMTALIVLRNKAIKPLLAAARHTRPTHRTHNPQPIDTHYRALQLAVQGVFRELGIAA